MIAGQTDLALAGDNIFANFVRFLTSSGSETPQLTIYFAVFFLLALGIFAWAAFWRKSGGKRSHRRHHHHHSKSPEAAPKPNIPDYEIPPRRRSKHRRRRRKQLPHNPTLAETGGLPPPRNDSLESPPPSV
jgi:hypothetical protein